MNISKNLKILPALLIYLFVFCLLMKAGYGSEDYEMSNLPSIIYLIQKLVTPLSILCILLLFFYQIINKEIVFSLSIPATIYLLVISCYFLRSYFVGSGNILNIVAILIFLILYLVLNSSKTMKTNIVYILEFSLGSWVVLNILIFFLGYGYNFVDGSSRFFGITGHPNFVGAYSSVALCLFVLKYKVKKNTIYIFMAFLSFFLILLSGSRSAMLASFLGILMIIPVYLWVIPFVSLALLYVLYISNIFSGLKVFSAIDRMREATLDNRNEVWNALLRDFFAHPLIGSGDASGVSGNGFLTALGGTGFFGFFGFILAYLLLLYVSLKNIFLKKNDLLTLEQIFFSAVVVIVSSLSMFEGYLFDKLGFFPVIFLICSIYLGPFHLKNRRR